MLPAALDRRMQELGERKDYLDAVEHEELLALATFTNERTLEKLQAELALREPKALDRARRDLHDQIETHKFIQFEFDRQRSDLKAHCARNAIRVMGDVPIYVAQDSSDVWAEPHMFDLEPDGRPRVIAGVPPDYFSATGQ